MTSSLFYLDHESIDFATIAHNWILFLILGLKFWFKVKKSKFRDTQIFQRTNFASPWTGPYKFFGPETFFVMSHMSQLKFWYLMTAISCLDSGDFTRWRALKVNLPPPPPKIGLRNLPLRYVSAEQCPPFWGFYLPRARGLYSSK